MPLLIKLLILLSVWHVQGKCTCWPYTVFANQVDRDLGLLREMGLTLRYALNTHCHADHITGSGEIKKRLTSVKSVISEASGCKADVLVHDGAEVRGKVLQPWPAPCLPRHVVMGSTLLEHEVTELSYSVGQRRRAPT